VQVPFDQHGAGALVTAILGGPLPHPGALLFWDRVESVLALLTAGQDIGGVELAGGTMAVGFAALAPEQVEGALNHRIGALEAAQGRRQSGVGTPELLAEAGPFRAQSDSVIY